MIKPIGLTIPKCECWKSQAKRMEVGLDFVAGEVCHAVIGGAISMSICDEAKEYYLASIIWAVLSAGIRTAKNDDGSCAMYRKEYENLYDKLKPLIMQRIDYADAVLLKEGK
jgi:hypothetical protein